MPVTSEQSAPYAPASGMLDIINRYRDRGMQVPINAEVLARAGVSESLVSRTLQALNALDLINDEGNPTEIFEGIRVAPEVEYKQRLQEWLRSSYADVFSYVDPMEDDEVKIRDAFRTYKPMGQQSRMVSLFIGLCDAAGLRPEKQVERVRAQSQRKAPTTKADGRKKQASKKPSTDTVLLDGLPAPLEGLLKSLPDQDSGWPKDVRDKFVTTFEAVLDYCYPIKERVSEEGAEPSDDDS